MNSSLSTICHHCHHSGSKTLDDGLVTHYETIWRISILAAARNSHENWAATQSPSLGISLVEELSSTSKDCHPGFISQLSRLSYQHWQTDSDVAIFYPVKHQLSAIVWIRLDAPPTKNYCMERCARTASVEAPYRHGSAQLFSLGRVNLVPIASTSGHHDVVNGHLKDRILWELLGIHWCMCVYMYIHRTLFTLYCQLYKHIYIIIYIVLNSRISINIYYVSLICMHIYIHIRTHINTPSFPWRTLVPSLGLSPLPTRLSQEFGIPKMRS